jgi:uncharacterized protein YfaT (DUF1175 family)
VARPIDELRNRRTIFLRKPLLAHFQLYVRAPVNEYIDSEIEEEIRRKKAEWAARGVPPGLQNMAVELAREWAARIAEFQLRTLEGVLPKEEIKRIADGVVKNLLKEALNTVAENWVKAFTSKK